MQTNPPSHINGRFAKGNNLGHGNPNHKAAYEARRLLFETIDPPRQMKLWKKIYSMAMKGNTAAMKILSDQLCGKPTVAVELSGPGGQPLQRTWGDVQIALFQAFSDDPVSKMKLAATLRQIEHQEVKKAKDDG